jgi:hypothetical protein
VEGVLDKNPHVFNSEQNLKDQQTAWLGSYLLFESLPFVDQVILLSRNRTSAFTAVEFFLQASQNSNQ